MLVLRTSLTSPFGRKVRIAAEWLGLSDRIEVVIADTADPADSLRRQNPLGKVPALLLEDGTVLYDSRVIVEYLDHLSGGGRLLPLEPERRFPALTMQALADGILDAALLQVYEKRWRDESMRSSAWATHQAEKVERGLTALEALDGGGELHIGHIAAACALAYLDLRFAGAWRADHFTLARWLDAFAARVPAFAATAPTA